MRLGKRFVASLSLCLFIGSLGMFGCADDDGTIDVAFMAGTYNLDKITETPAGGATTTLVPPYIEGTITLTASGTFSFDYVILGSSMTGGGTFTVDDPYVVFTETGDVKGVISNVTHGIVSDSGYTITVREESGDTSIGWVVTRQR